VTSPLGQVVILNGPPRSGKSTIAAAIQATFDGPWLNIGVDLIMRATPERYLPGIGLRPGSERPDLEPFVVASYAALYDSIAAHSSSGLNVVVDVGHHDAYSSSPLGILKVSAKRLDGLPAWFVGVRCPLRVLMARRAESEGYVVAALDSPEATPVRRWQAEVHRPGIYDVEVHTSRSTPSECAAVIAERLRQGPGSALSRIAAGSN
jgi:chloramphenicol 3-O phosphotransferase